MRLPVRSETALELSWVDTFIENVRPYIFVRREDNLLIKRPNQAQKVNAQGAAVLKELLDGKPIGALLDTIGRDPQKVRDIALFLFDVKRWLEGNLNEMNRTTATEVETFHMRLSEWPVLSEIALTYRCNLKCTFCYAGCNCTTNPTGDGREMTAKEIRSVLEKVFLDAKVPSVSFTGGEPTLRPDLPELVCPAAELGLRVNLITNGTCVTPSLAEALAKAGLASAQVSLEGVTEETHERVTSVSGSFAPTVSAVRSLAGAGIRVHTNTTINRDNLDECVKMPAFVNSVLGLERFSMNLLIPTGSAALNQRLVVRYSELGPHLLDISRAAEVENVELMWYSPTPMCLFNPVAHGLGNKGCSACDGLLSVAANGDVLPCSSYDDPLGNILREDVKTIWTSKKARRYRGKSFAYPACHSCEDFALCHGACPLYWRHMGFDELSAKEQVAS
jgi:radical SAM protein with 4Fe4S-binding SPASM domain